MNGTAADDAAALLCAATGQRALADAVHWVARGWKIAGVAEHDVLAALLAVPDAPGADAAIQRLSRSVAASEVSSAKVLFDLDIIDRPAAFRRALDQLAALTEDGTLTTVTAKDVMASQRKSTFTMAALCAVAGLSYRDLTDRIPDLPTVADGDWSPTQIRAAFSTIDAIVCGSERTDLRGATPTRPLDLLFSGAPEAGWAAVERARTVGVPYELLLAQRAAGGAWLAHRNRTSARVRHAVADDLATRLEEAGLPFLRGVSAGGTDPDRTVMAATGCGKQISFAVVDTARTARYGVVLAVANEGATARKSVKALTLMDRPAGLPVAVLLSGPGWATRNELADLARAFTGRIYGDSKIGDLVDDILKTSNSGGA